METFAKLFERFLVFVYHCFDRIVIQGYLPLLTRPEHIVHFFRDVHGIYPITPQVLAKRTPEKTWEMRGTSPSRVVYLVARTLRSESPEPRTQYLRAMDHLATQALDDDDRAAMRGIIEAIENDTPIPAPSPPKPNVVPPQPDQEAWWQAMRAAYSAGQLRDDDLALDPTYDALTGTHVLGDILRIRRDF